MRKSQRRPRPSDLGHSNPSNPSQESDFDEDEDGLSTPTAEKSMTSMLSVSSENVDRVGRRERFMKNNFESLSGADQQQQQSHNTISNQFREGRSKSWKKRVQLRESEKICGSFKNHFSLYF